MNIGDTAFKVRKSHMTSDMLDNFNKICKTGKETIEWHSVNWVAMSRNQYEKLCNRANREKMTIYFDEFDTVTDEYIKDMERLLKKHESIRHNRTA